MLLTYVVNNLFFSQFLTGTIALGFIFGLFKFMKTKHYFFPWFTSLLSLACIIPFILYQIYIAEIEPNLLFAQIGAPYAIQIYTGQYWGIVLNNFVHINFIHLGLNITGLFLFFSFLERRLSKLHLIALLLFASATTSLIQLTLTNDAGIGLSAVNFFLFFYSVGRSIKNNDFKQKHLKLYSISLTVLLTYIIISNLYFNTSFGTEAIMAGISLGLLTGWSIEYLNKYLHLTLQISLLLSCLSTLFYAPWSAEWNFTKGYQAHELNKFSEAKTFYVRTLEIEPNHESCIDNLRIIQLEELSDKALQAHEEENYIEAKNYYDQLLSIEPNNSWAIENIQKLP